MSHQKDDLNGGTKRKEKNEDVEVEGMTEKLVSSRSAFEQKLHLVQAALQKLKDKKKRQSMEASSVTPDEKRGPAFLEHTMDGKQRATTGSSPPSRSTALRTRRDSPQSSGTIGRMGTAKRIDASSTPQDSRGTKRRDADLSGATATATAAVASSSSKRRRLPANYPSSSPSSRKKTVERKPTQRGTVHLEAPTTFLGSSSETLYRSTNPSHARPSFARFTRDGEDETDNEERYRRELDARLMELQKDYCNRESHATAHSKRSSKKATGTSSITTLTNANRAIAAPRGEREETHDDVDPSRLMRGQVHPTQRREVGQQRVATTTTNYAAATRKDLYGSDDTCRVLFAASNANDWLPAESRPRGGAPLGKNTSWSPNVYGESDDMSPLPVKPSPSAMRETSHGVSESIASTTLTAPQEDGRRNTSSSQRARASSTYRDKSEEERPITTLRAQPSKKSNGKTASRKSHIIVMYPDPPPPQTSRTYGGSSARSSRHASVDRERAPSSRPEGREGSVRIIAHPTRRSTQTRSQSRERSAMTSSRSGSVERSRQPRESVARSDASAPRDARRSAAMMRITTSATKGHETSLKNESMGRPNAVASGAGWQHRPRESRMDPHSMAMMYLSRGRRHHQELEDNEDEEGESAGWTTHSLPPSARFARKSVHSLSAPGLQMHSRNDQLISASADATLPIRCKPKYWTHAELVIQEAMRSSERATTDGIPNGDSKETTPAAAAVTIAAVVGGGGRGGGGSTSLLSIPVETMREASLERAIQERHESSVKRAQSEAEGIVRNVNSSTRQSLVAVSEPYQPLTKESIVTVGQLPAASPSSASPSRIGEAYSVRGAHRITSLRAPSLVHPVPSVTLNHGTKSNEKTERSTGGSSSSSSSRANMQGGETDNNMYFCTSNSVDGNEETGKEKDSRDSSPRPTTNLFKDFNEEYEKDASLHRSGVLPQQIGSYADPKSISREAERSIMRFDDAPTGSYYCDDKWDKNENRAVQSNVMQAATSRNAHPEERGAVESHSDEKLLRHYRRASQTPTRALVRSTKTNEVTLGTTDLRWIRHSSQKRSSLVDFSSSSPSTSPPPTNTTVVINLRSPASGTDVVVTCVSPPHAMGGVAGTPVRLRYSHTPGSHRTPFLSYLCSPSTCTPSPATSTAKKRRNTAISSISPTPKRPMQTGRNHFPPYQPTSSVDAPRLCISAVPAHRSDAVPDSIRSNRSARAKQGPQRLSLSQSPPSKSRSHNLPLSPSRAPSTSQRERSVSSSSAPPLRMLLAPTSELRPSSLSPSSTVASLSNATKSVKHEVTTATDPRPKVLASLDTHDNTKSREAFQKSSTPATSSYLRRKSQASVTISREVGSGGISLRQLMALRHTGDTEHASTLNERHQKTARERSVPHTIEQNLVASHQQIQTPPKVSKEPVRIDSARGPPPTTTTAVGGGDDMLKRLAMIQSLMSSSTSTVSSVA